MSIMRYHIMGNDDIRLNLATEEYLLNNFTNTEPLILLYIQKPCVILGRNQNIYEEVDLNFLKTHPIEITRRISGGGAVYDDLGNLSFCLIGPKEALTFGDYQDVTKPIVDALVAMGATDITAAGRNDLYIDDKKFSGNAMYTKNNRTYAHGTLMYDVDISVLDNVLTRPSEKSVSKAIPSITASVTNIKSYLAPEYQFAKTSAFRDALLCQIFKVDHISEISEQAFILSDNDQRKIYQLFLERYANEFWIYGELSTFTTKKRKRFAKVGIVDVRLKVINGTIAELKVYGDYFSQKSTDELSTLFEGTLFTYTACAKSLATVSIGEYIYQLTNDQFLALLFE